MNRTVMARLRSGVLCRALRTAGWHSTNTTTCSWTGLRCHSFNVVTELYIFGGNELRMICRAISIQEFGLGTFRHTLACSTHVTELVRQDKHHGDLDVDSKPVPMLPRQACSQAVILTRL